MIAELGLYKSPAEALFMSDVLLCLSLYSGSGRPRSSSAQKMRKERLEGVVSSPKTGGGYDE